MQSLPQPNSNDDAAPVPGTGVTARGAIAVPDRRAANQPQTPPSQARRASDPPPAVAAGKASPQTTTAKQLLENYLTRRQATVLQLVAELLDAPNLGSGLASLADALHQRFDCQRVVIGLFHGSRLRIETISQQAGFDPRSDEVEMLRDALQEACDQDVILQFPAADRTTLSTTAHAALCLDGADTRLLSLPLCHDGELVGAMLLQTESRSDWSRFTLELLGQVAELSAALIRLRHESERGLPGALRRSLHAGAQQITGPHHVMAKSLVGLVFITTLAAAMIPVTYRIKAEAEIVPITRRVISAPVEGFVDSVQVRVGDRARAGDELLRLDTRQLTLEKTRLSSEIRGIETEIRAARASRDRKETVVLYARRSEASAELERVEQQIERSVLRAPVDGIIVDGDINEIVGAPVKLGDSLMQIAPIEGQDVHLLVDERDIGRVRVGQRGSLSLTSSPGQTIPFDVATIHPIARSTEGRNRIRVEAALPTSSRTPLPGQTGIGKIAVGESSLLWVWTHRFVDWARQQGWVWFG